jgi:tRNA (guanine-N7-)-methyltransferase
MRRKPNLTARIEQCGSLLVKEPEKMRGDWLTGSGCHELRLEIGCGKGRFLVESAKAEPDVLFVGLEKWDNVLVSSLERAAADGLRNTRFVCAFAEDLTDYFAPGEASLLYINFCDPWPSDRHAKRRLTGPRFLGLYSKVLRPGGRIDFKTDNLPLFEFSLNEFEYRGFKLLDVTRDLHKDGPAGVMTDYELKFYGEGFPIYRCLAEMPLAE